MGTTRAPRRSLGTEGVRIRELILITLETRHYCNSFG